MTPLGGSLNRLVVVSILAGLALSGCGDDPKKDLTAATGGAAPTGTGGAAAAAAAPAVGGNTASGGDTSAGGAATGGDATVATGGDAPAATGGAPEATGGDSATGGASEPGSGGGEPGGSGATTPGCVGGIDTGDTCDVAVDNVPCERSDRTCICQADNTWLCTPKEGGEEDAGTSDEVRPCEGGIDTGDLCDPAESTEVCERSDRDCTCGTDGVWTCTPTEEEPDPDPEPDPEPQGTAGATATPFEG